MRTNTPIIATVIVATPIIGAITAIASYPLIGSAIAGIAGILTGTKLAAALTDRAPQDPDPDQEAALQAATNRRRRDWRGRPTNETIQRGIIGGLTGLAIYGAKTAWQRSPVAVLAIIPAIAITALLPLLGAAGTAARNTLFILAASTACIATIELIGRNTPADSTPDQLDTP
jgi:hypothetical protein